MSIRFDTTRETREQWPKTDNGEYQTLKDVNDVLLGKHLSEALSKYYDGWDCSNKGEQSWFFFGVPEELRVQVIASFTPTGCPYMTIHSKSQAELDAD